MKLSLLFPIIRFAENTGCKLLERLLIFLVANGLPIKHAHPKGDLIKLHFHFIMMDIIAEIHFAVLNLS